MTDSAAELAPSAGVAVLDDEGRLLLVQRADDGSWCLPGGRLQAGESFADCARRECREELGCDVTLDGLAGVGSNPGSQIHGYPDGRTVQFVGVVFRGRLAGSLATGDGEVTAARWFTADDLPVPIMPPDLPFVRHVLSSDPDPLVD